MPDFPEFIKSLPNRIDSSQQNTQDVEGYYYQGTDGGQVAFWTCRSDQVSRVHQNPFDEYMVCVEGQYTALVDDKEYILNPGDELFIPKNSVQSGRCVAGTRTIHAFGGQRIKKQ